MKLPVVSSKELISFLEKEGFILLRQKGSHTFFKHPDGRTTVIPVHNNREISKGLLSAILSEINISREYFLRRLKK